jgi:hypothetical protein
MIHRSTIMSSKSGSGAFSTTGGLDRNRRA